MNSFRRRTEAATLAILLCAHAACIDQGELFGPGPVTSGLPRVRLTEASYAVYAGDTITIRLEGMEGRTGRAELLVLDRARAVVWRSDPSTATDSVARIPVGAIPQTLVGDTTLHVSAALVMNGGVVYASDDTAAVISPEEAALRPVRFRAGELLALSAGTPQSLALDGATGRLLFAGRDRPRIGSIDLAAMREAGGADVPAGSVTLRALPGRLAALIADGTELALFDVGEHLEPRERTLLPPLRLEVESADAAADGSGDTLAAAVRPYGRGLAWGCAVGEATGCSRGVAFTASALAGSTGLGVMRRTATGGGAMVGPMVVPAYERGLLASDTAASKVRVYMMSGSGGDSLVAQQTGRMRCATLNLGGGVFDVAARVPRPLYVAVQGELACGEGSRLMRIDDPASADPRVNAVALRNLSGEDRIGAPHEVRVSPDGSAVLVRAEDRVHVFDADLRLRATFEVADPSAVAWVEGGPADSRLFAIVSEDGIALYDVARRTPALRFPLGPLREGLLILWGSGSDLVAVAVPEDRDGIVTLRIPVP